MTMSLTAYDPDTGAFGVVIASADPRSAARCIALRAGVGAVASLHAPHPGLATAVLDRIGRGSCALEAVREVVGREPHGGVRQLAAVDADGAVGQFVGEEVGGMSAACLGSGAVAAGCRLASDEVPWAMLEAFESSGAAELEVRLLDGLAAGLRAGGTDAPIRSAGLAVVEDFPWRLSDIRVDDVANPADELERLTRLWLPRKGAHRARLLASAYWESGAA